MEKRTELEILFKNYSSKTKNTYKWIDNKEKANVLLFDSPIPKCRELNRKMVQSLSVHDPCIKNPFPSPQSDAWVRWLLHEWHDNEEPTTAVIDCLLPVCRSFGISFFTVIASAVVGVKVVALVGGQEAGNYRNTSRHTVSLFLWL